MMTDPYNHVREAFHITADGLMGWNAPPGPFLRKRTPTESTLRAIERIERAADSLMRLGDPQNAISLYGVALMMRAEVSDE